MVSCELTIQTVGVDSAVVEQMKAVPPLERFSHIFQAFGSFGEMGELARKNGDRVLILDESMGMEAVVRFLEGQEPSPQMWNILCTGNISGLTEETLNHFYDLWLTPLTPASLNFYFRRLQKQMKEETLERAYEQKILEMARQDCLTGLATRWYLQEYVEQNRDEKHITCIYFDLDHFKEVNDTYGHQAGDEALAATAELMQQEFSDGFISRLGGDEFMVVLLGKRSIGDTEARVNAFLTRLMDYYWEASTMRHLSISAGIAQTDPAVAKSIDQLIHESDRALYRAKHAGRACCRIYDPSMETTGRGQ